MKFFTAALAMAAAANAHTLMSKLYINGESQGDATCIRMPKEGDTATSPVAGLTSEDMACGKLLPRLRPATTSLGAAHFDIHIY